MYKDFNLKDIIKIVKSLFTYISKTIRLHSAKTSVDEVVRETNKNAKFHFNV